MKTNNKKTHQKFSHNPFSSNQNYLNTHHVVIMTSEHVRMNF